VNTWHIEPLTEAHDLSDFDFGNAGLSEWLKTSAGQFRKKDLAQNYVLVEPDQVLVRGYYSISTASVSSQRCLTASL
jgi:hypothetical protein